MISVNEAFRLVLSAAPGFGDETVPLEQSCGRVLRQPVAADRDFPPCDRVSMDGIAILHEAYAEGRREFHRQGLLAAGEAPPALAGPEACVEVMTGAMLPPGADTVIPYEHLEELPEDQTMRYRATKKVVAGQYVHSRGADAGKGTTLLGEGEIITPPMIALMASAGIPRVKVGRLPRIAIIGTGDELIPLTGEPQPYQFRQSNAYSLQAVLGQYGVSARLYHTDDDADGIRELLRQIRQIRSAAPDGIITTGGVSAGRKDHVPRIFREEGGEIVFHKVAQRPGKPFLFGGWKDGPALFGLPGNPVSCMAGCCRYVVPWIMQGLGLPVPLLFAKLEEEVLFEPALTYFMQVRITLDINGERWAQPLKGKGSGDLIGGRRADAFMELPAGKHFFRKGESYPVWPVSIPTGRARS